MTDSEKTNHFPRRAAAAISAIVMGLIALVAIPASPAAASVCSDFPYASPQVMRDSACRENTIDPGQGNLLTRIDMTTGRANQLLNGEGFSDTWIWFARKTTRTFTRGDGQQWSYCNTYNGTYDPDGYFTTQGFVCDGDLPLGRSGDVMYSFASTVNSVELDVLEYGGGFVSLVCGNFGTQNPSDPAVDIEGRKFLDTNGNGVWDSDEDARSGITFRLTRVSSLFGDRPANETWETITDANGRYRFDVSDKGPGTYQLEEVLPEGWRATNDPSRTIVVADGGGDHTYTVADIGNITEPPVVEVFDHTIDEGQTVTFSDATAYSPAGLELTYVWTPGDKLDDATLLHPTYTGLDDAVDEITLTATDTYGQSGSDTATITTLNVAPVTELGDNATLDEGETFTRSGLTYSDVGILDTHTATVDYGDGTGSQPLALDQAGDGTGTYELSHTYVDDDPTATPVDDYTVTVTITDDDGGEVTDTIVVTVNDVAPDLAITGPVLDGDLFAAPAIINLEAPFTDPGTRDTFECRIDWDEADATLEPAAPETVFDAPFSGTTGDCNATHTYDKAGVYTVRVTVTDDDTLFDVEERMIVVYDPSAGFVTGGGFIDSPAGALVADPDATGKATFGFVSKYKKNSTTPEGNTEFQFHAGDFNFHSGDYDWLVVTANGTRAQYKGSGTINGNGDYGFILTAYDNGEPGSNVDQLRMKIWDKTTDQLVYDNRNGASDDVDRADPQVISQGNIVIHTKNGRQ